MQIIIRALRFPLANNIRENTAWKFKCLWAEYVYIIRVSIPIDFNFQFAAAPVV